MQKLKNWFKEELWQSFIIRNQGDVFILLILSIGIFTVFWSMASFAILAFILCVYSVFRFWEYDNTFEGLLIVVFLFAVFSGLSAMLIADLSEEILVSETTNKVHYNAKYIQDYNVLVDDGTKIIELSELEWYKFKDQNCDLRDVTYVYKQWEHFGNEHRTIENKIECNPIK